MNIYAPRAGITTFILYVVMGYDFLSTSFHGKSDIESKAYSFLIATLILLFYALVSIVRIMRKR